MSTAKRSVAVRRHPERSEGAGLGRFALLSVTAGALLIVACSSPEAGRKPGQAGADVRNWGNPVEFHAGAQPFHDTPCVTEKVECQGPPAVFGPTPAPD